jgi:hypothetical protein
MAKMNGIRQADWAPNKPPCVAANRPKCEIADDLAMPAFEMSMRRQMQHHKATENGGYLPAERELH